MTREIQVRERMARAEVTRGKPARGGLPSKSMPKVNVSDWDLAEQSASLRLERAEDEEQYGAFFRRSHLSTTTRERFLATRARHREDTVSAAAAIKSEGLTDKDPAAVAVKRAAEDRLKTAERALLGEETYQELQRYERTQWIREQVTGRLAGLLVFTDEPLRAKQADQLLHAVAAASADLSAPAADRQVDWAAVEDQSRQFLSPKQQARFVSIVTADRRDTLIAKVKELITEPPPDLPP